MSRLAQPKASPVSKRDPRMGGAGQDEICPVCKSSRYMNPSLRFLVNPECYHKMCESCVDRIFSHGPAKCPIPGCPRTLRKHRFREQTFEDIQVEREVDIRRRVASVFNRREDEFETLRDWNDYLNDVEDITFNLINQIDIAETEKRFEAYQKSHEKEIEENAAMAVQERQSFSAQQKQERQLARERREAARREEEAEKRELEENRRDVLKRLASGADAEKIAKEGQQVQLKKRMDRQAAAERQRQLQAADTTRNGTTENRGPLIKGLKAKPKPAEPEPPIDPFGGIRFATKYFVPQTDYVWEGVQEAKKDAKVSAGGYDALEYAQRSLVAAFSGLGVFVADEVTERERAKVDEEAVGTMRADIGLKDSEMADA